MQKTALLIIDVQTAMFTYENFKLFNEQQILANLLQLVEKARSSQIPVIFIQHTSSDETDEFYRGSSTWEIYPMLSPRADELIIQKTTWDAFHLTPLHEELQKLEIEHLIIAGMQTEFCLDTSCRRAFSMGYQNVLVQDAHSTFDGRILTAGQIIQHHNAIIGGRFAKLKTTSELIEQEMGR
ncbi:cysteine hydrolase [Paenibacillus psychroresistens]|uniref:Cysteine hydrolase n=1 Tax=Paenibacillus psychroresistens TaxID=1778678 RepID=A0A6B8RXR8_9BACL|nr:cysteine hydrolase family protein [Paenibacillus psychroresistens]QGR00124.1 cysteine hydrolase [Paenibacillus psychroresistens]